MARDLRLEVVMAAIDKATAPLKGIARGSGELASALKTNREQLKALNAQQGDISSFAKLKQATQQTQEAMDASQRKVRELAQAMNASGAPTKAMANDFKRAQREAQALKQKHDQQQQALQGLRGKLGAAGISTRNLSEADRKLRADKSRLNGEIDEQTAKLKALGNMQKRNAAIAAKAAAMERRGMIVGAKGAAGVFAAQAALRGGAGLLAPQMAAQQQGAMIAAQGGEDAASGQRYTNVIKGIKGDGLGADVAEIGAAVAAVNSTLGALGAVSDQELDRASRKALDLSGAFGLDVAENIQTVSILMQNGLAKSSDEAFDLLTRGLQQVSTQMRGEMPEILHEYSTHFRGMGFSGSEAMSLLVDMAKQGKFALDKTGDAIKEFSIRGSDMSKASVTAYEEIGLSAEQMSAAIASGGAGARSALQQTAKGLLDIADPSARANAAIALFGTPVEDLAIDQIPAFLSALAGGRDNMGEFAGAASQLGDTLRDNLGGDIGKLRGAWGALTGALAEGEGGALRDLVQRVSGLVGGVTSWIKENPKLASTLFKVGAGLAVVVGVLGTLGVVVGTAMMGMGVLLKAFLAVKVAIPILAALSGGLLAAGKAVLLLGKALLLSPIGLIVAVIAGGAYLIWRNWETLGPKFAALWSGITAGIASLWAEIKLGFSGGISGIAALIVNFSPLGLFYKVFAGVMGYFGLELPAKFTEFGGMMMQGLVNGIKNAAGAVKDAVTGAGGAAIGWFKEKLGINSPSRVFAELGGYTMQGLQQGLTASQGGPLKTVTGITKQLAAAGALTLGVGAGSALAIDSRPPLAAGTAAAAAASPASITINVQASPGMDEAALARLVAQEVQRITSNQAARSRSALHDRD